VTDAQAKINGVYIHCNLGKPTVNVDTGASAWSVTGRHGTIADTEEIRPIQTFMEGEGRLMFFQVTV
jgi:hypothetical protein